MPCCRSVSRAGLREIAGVEVEDYLCTSGARACDRHAGFRDRSSIWAERLALIGKKDAQVSLRVMANQTAGSMTRSQISVNGYGKGLVYYVGVYLDEGAQRALLAQHARDCQGDHHC